MTHPKRSSIFRTLAAFAASAALLAGCGSTDSDSGSDAAGGADAGEDTAGAMVTVPKLTGIAWFNRMEEGVNEYADDSGNNAYYQGSSEADAAAQVKVLEDLIASEVGALCVTPFQPDAVEQTLKKAQDAGIVVVTHEAPTIKNADYDVEAFHNADYGVNLMDLLAKEMGEEGEYALMVGSLSSTTHMEWVEAAKKHQEEKYPNMTQVGDIIETSDDSQKAYEKMQELLSAYPNLKGVQGSASTDVVGVGQAVEEAGLQDTIAVVGTSTPKDTKALLESGAIDVIQFWDPGKAAYAQNVIAKLLMDGETLEDGMDLGVEGYGSITIEDKIIYGDNAWINVTKDNADDYDF
ncbi:MAG: autoinducer 2 ABC transporter substrate-binding protein [Bowdeniella nasicola]|nr:autoinducer 2 ABC transporter substrate-binding protein [Bowdeniella nasicola]